PPPSPSVLQPQRRPNPENNPATAAAIPHTRRTEVQPKHERPDIRPANVLYSCIDRARIGPFLSVTAFTSASAKFSLFLFRPARIPVCFANPGCVPAPRHYELRRRDPYTTVALNFEGDVIYRRDNLNFSEMALNIFM